MSQPVVFSRFQATTCGLKGGTKTQKSKKIFRFFLLTGIFIFLFSKQTGDPSSSFPSWPAPQSPGGSAIIPCDYIITVKESCNGSRVRSRVSAAVTKMAERSVLQIKII